jgi:hypothetical protein
MPVTYAYAAVTNGCRDLSRQPGPFRFFGARQRAVYDDPNLHRVLQDVHREKG